jgi:hypothetical protein
LTFCPYVDFFSPKNGFFFPPQKIGEFWGIFFPSVILNLFSWKVLPILPYHKIEREREREKNKSAQNSVQEWSL